MSTTTAKREVLDELIADSQAKLADLQDELSQEQRLLERLRIQRHILGSDEPSSPSPPAATQATLFYDEALSIPQHIERLLRAHDAPMRAADISRKLATAGVPTKSEKGLLPQVLSALSRKTSTFHRVGRGLYGLAEWQNRNGEGPERA